MAGAEPLGHLPRVAGLVVLRSEVVGHGEGADVADAHLVHQGDDGAGVDAAREEDAQGTSLRSWRRTASRSRSIDRRTHSSSLISSVSGNRRSQYRPQLQARRRPPAGSSRAGASRCLRTACARSARSRRSCRRRASPRSTRGRAGATARSALISEAKTRPSADVSVVERLHRRAGRGPGTARRARRSQMAKANMPLSCVEAVARPTRCRGGG